MRRRVFSAVADLFAAEVSGRGRIVTQGSGPQGGTAPVGAVFASVVALLLSFPLNIASASSQNRQTRRETFLPPVETKACGFTLSAMESGVFRRLPLEPFSLEGKSA
jgi:hypothetical protein